MQSFLQYRRFGRHVEAQYKHDQEKAKGSGSGLSSNNASPFSPASPAQASRDLERAEQRNGNSKESLQRDASAADPLPAEEAFENAEERNNDPLSREITVRQSVGTALGMVLTGIDVRKRKTREGGGKGDVFVVGYEGEKDNMNPHNWSRWTRIGAT